MMTTLADCREAYLRAVAALLNIDEEAGFEEMESVGTALGCLEAGANVEDVIRGLKSL